MSVFEVAVPLKTSHLIWGLVTVDVLKMQPLLYCHARVFLWKGVTYMNMYIVHFHVYMYV